MTSDEVVAAEETAPAHSAKATKAGAAYGYKKKPVKVVKAPLPLRNQPSNQTGSLALPEPPPALVSTPAPMASPLVQIPKVPEDLDGPSTDKPKKNIWHKLAAPFRGKSSNNNEPPAPDGGN